MGMAVFAGGRYFRKECRKKQVCAGIVFVLIFSAGFLCMEYAWKKWERIEERLPENKEEVVLSGKVLDIRESGQNCTILIQTEPMEQVLLYVDLEMAARLEKENLQIGGKIQVKGEARRLQRAGNPGQFDQYSYHHAKKNIPSYICP